MIASLPEAPGSTLVQPLEWVSKRSYEAVGRAGKSPTAAPIVVPPPAGYVNGWPTKCWFVLAPTVMILRARPGDTQVTVRSEVRQSGAQAVSIDYEMEKTPSGWKVYDVKISGASLAATYRDTFAEEVRNHGIEGLIDSLSGKNRQNDARPASINT